MVVIVKELLLPFDFVTTVSAQGTGNSDYLISWWETGDTFDAGATIKDKKAGFKVTEKSSKAVVSGDGVTLRNQGINGQFFYKNKPAEYVKVMKYVKPGTAVSQAFKAKGNYITGAISIGINTYSDVSQVKGDYNKAVVGVTDVAFGIAIFAGSTAAGAWAGAAVGSAICPGVGTVVGAVVGFGVGYFADKWSTPVKREIQYQLAPEVRGKFR